MATGKGRGARDTIYGRRGGGWVDQGYDPQAQKRPVGGPSLDDEARKERQRVDIATFIADHPETIPTFVTHNGKHAVGGQTFEGRARMAAARSAAQPQAAERLASAKTTEGRVLAMRRVADLELDDIDRQALDRHHLYDIGAAS